ncbi:MAG: preprotein translocase subunit SecG [Acidobacteriota bacterium]|nr:preprotein translocase subunit SecG [Acidobacteriota bacterium]
MIVTVLLQPGKADAGALFTSSVSSTAFGPRGTQSILAKVTIISAALFMLLALALSLPALTGSRSVLQSIDAEATPQPTATPAPAPTAAATTPDAPTSTAPDAANTNNVANPAPAQSQPSPATAASPQEQK